MFVHKKYKVFQKLLWKRIYSLTDTHSQTEPDFINNNNTEIKKKYHNYDYCFW